MRATRGDTAAPAECGVRARLLRLALFMAGIQYSTARTGATGPAGDLVASSIRESRRTIGKSSGWHSSGRAKAAGKAHSPAPPVVKTPAGVSRFTGARREER